MSPSKVSALEPRPCTEIFIESSGQVLEELIDLLQSLLGNFGRCVGIIGTHSDVSKAVGDAHNHDQLQRSEKQNEGRKTNPN